MVWVRILVGLTWLDGAAEKLANGGFPQQFAATVHSGGYVRQAPGWFKPFMQGVVSPHAGLFANLTRAGELGFGLLLLFGLLTNLAALWSIVYSLVLLFSQGGVGFGMGLGPPGILTINLVVALLSLVILLSPEAKAFSVDGGLAGRSRTLAILLTNRERATRRNSA